MGRAFRVIRVVAVLEHFGVASDCLIYMGTLSKAYGAIAGFVAATSGKTTAPKAQLSCSSQHVFASPVNQKPDPTISSRRPDVTHTASLRVPEMLNKVPEVTLIFWAIKIMSTTVGETGADYLAVHVGLGTTVTGAVMVCFLAIALGFQLRMRRYVPAIYWLTVVLVSVVGTQITDALTDKLEISLYVSTVGFAVALAITFAVWYRSERTLSIHTIVTMRRELFYWGAILFTFALGTAAGDLATEALGLGFNLGVVLFGALIAVIAGAYYLGANPVLTFWLAYILTRPLGASLGDLLSQSRNYGGFGLGTPQTSVAFLTVIIGLVAWVTFEGERQRERSPA
jgi:uncharacterized membrane-anchored protein